MLFYEFLLSKTDTRVTVTLKNKMVLSGNLKKIDPYLNIRLDQVDTVELPMQKMSMCSIYGIAIKSIELENTGDLKKLNEGSRLCISNIKNLISK